MDPTNLKAFLGLEQQVNTLRYLQVEEEFIRENVAEHRQECNSRPWCDFRKVVPLNERCGIPTKWDFKSFEGVLLKQQSPKETYVAMSETPLFSASECSQVIEEAEQVAAWTQGFPYASKENEQFMPHRTPVEKLPRSTAFLGNVLATRVYPLLETAFPDVPEARAQHLRLYQATVLKYNSSGSPILTPVHQDFSFLTLTVSLNDPVNYQGGGDLDRRPERFWSVWHAGHPVQGGVRYVLAMFFCSTKFIDHSLRFEQRASNALRRGQMSEAIQLYRLCVKYNPHALTAWCVLANLHWTSAEHEAVAECQRVVEEGLGKLDVRDWPPSYKGVLLNLAKLYMKMEDPEKAISALKLCIDIDPDWKEARSMISSIT
ncbi:hypothetical protein GUITHDRAFT_111874 [Guillardia theta CCMP2712]|uniref:Uncharacterized protein n=1 Tax=Guillardia theta (strain CCMP2712) TaxID=905079 RepID=L1J1K2_GUITC|nr:hypothetical protein GUITHDRAFT_111874 [Guillardia theta CCMP2712]EKX42019.1 hypothetical protein GUITHDRAFT_111874 [Guillardia theta CCMP2712]|eukprot:XP_005828999.1 hypothetical protein GUITHDRAFT_111874 [Guillardia theta CCMP2712]